MNNVQTTSIEKEHYTPRQLVPCEPGVVAVVDSEVCCDTGATEVFTAEMDVIAWALCDVAVWETDRRTGRRIVNGRPSQYIESPQILAVVIGEYGPRLLTSGSRRFEKGGVRYGERNHRNPRLDYESLSYTDSKQTDPTEYDEGNAKPARIIPPPAGAAPVTTAVARASKDGEGCGG